MYTDDEIKKAGTDAGFTTHEVDTLFYQLIENKKHEPLPQLKQADVIGSAFVWGSWRDVEVIDESKLSELNLIRVIWRDDQNRRVTSFVLPNEVKKHCL